MEPGVLAWSHLIGVDTEAAMGSDLLELTQVPCGRVDTRTDTTMWKKGGQATEHKDSTSVLLMWFVHPVVMKNMFIDKKIVVFLKKGYIDWF